MATRKQKQDLIDTLKFAPRPISIQLSGRGGECYIGRVTRAQYEFFRAHKIDVEEYASDWDDDIQWNFVPDEAGPLAPGTPYECDDLFHASGATMGDDGRLTVTDTDTGQDLFETSLEIRRLEDQGIAVSCGDDFDSDDLDPGIQAELDAYNPLVPTGSNLKATLTIEYGDSAVRARKLKELHRVEDQVYVKVEGHAPVYAIADEDMDRSTDEKTSAVHFLRFELTEAMIQDFQSLDRESTVGVDHPAYMHKTRVNTVTKHHLVRDFAT